MVMTRCGSGDKKIGVLGMVVVGFFWVHGGIYGNEAMLMAGPPLYVFIMLGIVPFVYSLPIALIVAELSSAFPEDGGYVVWVQEACGKAVGSHHAYWVWVIYVVDAAIYPVLVANYVDTMVPMGDTSRGLLATAIVIGVTLINLAGTDVMVKFNTLLAIVSLAPTLVFMFLGLPSVSLSKCLVAEGDADWTLLVSWILWLYCGFFSLGTLAGELENPRSTFTIAIAILFPAVLLLNTLPLAVALGLDDRLDHYSAGYFNVLAGRLAGVWLDGAFQLGANVCLVGLYNAAVLTAERSLCFLVSTQFGDAIEEYATSKTAGRGALGRVLRTLLSTSQTGVAPLYILTNAVCAGILVWMPYTLLVEFSMLLSVPSILLFMWSFVALRIQRPSVDRPFLIPGGLPVAVLLTVVPVAISISYAAIITTESSFNLDEITNEPASRSSDGGLPPIFQVISMGAVIALGCVVHFMANQYARHMGKADGTLRLGGAGDGGMEPLSPLPSAVMDRRSNNSRGARGGDGIERGDSSEAEELQGCLTVGGSACAGRRDSAEEGLPSPLQMASAGVVSGSDSDAPPKSSAPSKSSAVRVTRSASSSSGSSGRVGSATIGQSPVEAAARLVSSVLRGGKSNGGYQAVTQ